MWKPGSAKPVGALPKIQNNNAKSPSNGSSSAKKLSTSTMGMRFMQRKSKGTSDKAVIQNAVAARKGTNRNHTTSRSPVDRKRVSEDISKDEQSTSPNTTSNDGVIILELASVVDMYGVGSDIIGRRSFGGFHKSVKNTYDAALKRRVDDEARTNNTKAHITDEELLARYEKYVKGGSKSGGSGNRGRKEKRKRG